MSGKKFGRRSVLGFLGAGAAMPLVSACSESAQARDYPVNLSEAEWRARLTPAQYSVLRQEGTERPYTSALNNESREGVFHCAGCDNALYSSDTKYDSRTGWPSFWQAIDSDAVGYATDYKLGYPRREVHCADCGGHLGHVFNDGPRPTGKRHCINGVAMVFRPA